MVFTEDMTKFAKLCFISFHSGNHRVRAPLAIACVRTLAIAARIDTYRTVRNTRTVAATGALQSQHEQAFRRDLRTDA